MGSMNMALGRSAQNADTITDYNAAPRNVSEEVANQCLVPPVLDGARIAGLRPVRPVTQAEIDTFWRDGVVV